MQTILITGAAGFIGSSLADALISKYRVICIDNFNDYYDPAIKESNIQQIKDNKNYTLYPADICDENAMSDIFNRNSIDMVIHLAARAGVRPSIEEPTLYMETNVTGTSVLLNLCQKHGIKKFIFASSSSVYGALKEGPFSEDMAVANTISPYAASKVAGEVLCQTFANLYKMNIVALRFFTVYGPRQRPDLAINKFTNLIKEGKPIPVYGDGTTQRNYTYIDDIVDGIIRCFDYNEKPYEVFNLGGDETVSLSELISTIEKALGKTAIINRLPDQPGDVPLTHANIDKLRNAVGYQPSTDIVAGINKYINSL